MKRGKSSLLFSCLLFMIVLGDFLLYRNIEHFLPTQEKEVFTFANDRQLEQNDFFTDIFILLETKGTYKKVQDSETIKNTIVYPIIQHSIFPEETDEAIQKYMMKVAFTGDLNNTIYGDLHVIWIENWYFLYTEDGKKICFLDMYQNANTYSAVDSNAAAAGLYDNTIEEFSHQQTKEELLAKVKHTFADVLPNTVFEPDHVSYKAGYYILKDTSADITMYYNPSQDSMIGFYMGFGK